MIAGGQPATPVLEIDGLSKKYGGLRPLRIQRLTVAAAERVAVSGIDAAATELLVNLITGASLPDAGRVLVLGRSTAEISGGDEWLSSLDRFGIVSDRAVMLEGATLAQNIAMPFTLEIDPVPAEVRARVDALAAECGIDPAWLDRAAGDSPPAVRMRAHLARAVAPGPALLILEHPTASVASPEHRALAADISRVIGGRGAAALVVTMDQAFGHAVAHRTMALHGATGDVRPVRRGWFR
jgi:ABC-type transporter Mla maintaining outer membrane lipid asymmetry ATPase subunit MlaF